MNRNWIKILVPVVSIALDVCLMMLLAWGLVSLGLGTYAVVAIVMVVYSTSATLLLAWQKRLEQRRRLLELQTNEQFERVFRSARQGRDAFPFDGNNH